MYRCQHEMIPLTSSIIKDFATLLGEEALGYYQHIKRIRSVAKEEFETYKEFYAKFHTVPILFLSVVPGKGVYLWQVNRLCPYKKGSNYMILDSKTTKTDVKVHISILLLAKIAPEEGEEIIDAVFTQGSHLCTKSVIGEQQLIIRRYKIKEFSEMARVNPFKQEILANNKHSSKLVIKEVLNDEGSQSSLDITLWRNKTTEELKKETVSSSGEFESLHNVKEICLQSNRSLRLDMIYVMRNFSNLIGTQNGGTLLFDTKTTTAIVWSEKNLCTKIYNKFGNVDGIAAEGNEVCIKMGTTKYYVLPFEDFPSQDLKLDPPISHELIFPKLFFISFSSGSNESEPRYEDKGNLMYDAPISVVNPYLEEANTNVHKQIKENEIGKKGYGFVESLSKIKNQLKQKKKGQADFKSGLKDRKKILKDIRSVMEYSKEGDRIKMAKGPEGVSKEAIELYNEVKTEKKRIEKEREREKEKTQKKKRGYHNDNY